MKLRRMIFQVQVDSPKQVIPIDLLLPGDALQCNGIQALISGVFPSFREAIPNFGEYSLEFSGHLIHPIHAQVPYINPSSLTQENYHRIGIIPLDVSLTDNKLVTGYYRDLDEQANERSAEFMPYSVKFIFQLLVP